VPTLFGVLGYRTIVTIGALDLGHIIWDDINDVFCTVLYTWPANAVAGRSLVDSSFV
jgi:hypothetical protein